MRDCNFRVRRPACRLLLNSRADRYKTARKVDREAARTATLRQKIYGQTLRSIIVATQHIQQIHMMRYTTLTLQFRFFTEESVYVCYARASDLQYELNDSANSLVGPIS